MFAVGENVGLVRQIAATRVDEINAGQTVFTRDLLGAKMFLHRQRIIGSALNRGVVADDDAFAALDAPDAGDDPRAVNVAAIHLEGGERRKLQERRAEIDQPLHPFARQQLAAFAVAFPASLVTAKRGGFEPRFQLADQRGHRRSVGIGKLDLMTKRQT